MRRIFTWVSAAAICLALLTGCANSEAKGAARLAGIEALNAGSYSDAVGFLNEALNLSNGRVGKFELDVLKYRVEAEYKLGDYEAAAGTCDALIQADRERAVYLYLNSMAKAGLGKLEEARTDFEKAYAMDPESPRMEEAMIAVTAAMEQSEEFRSVAFSIYESMIAEGVQNAQVYNRMGMNKLKEAIALSENVTADGAKSDAEEYFDMRVQMDQRCDEALACFEEGLKTGDEKARQELMRNQAAAYEYKGEFQRALEILNAYVGAFGTDEEIEKEIAFLETR